MLNPEPAVLGAKRILAMADVIAVEIEKHESARPLNDWERDGVFKAALQYAIRRDPVIGPRRQLPE